MTTQLVQLFRQHILFTEIPKEKTSKCL